MAIVTMADAVAGNTASSAEYNKVTANIRDLDSRVSTNTSGLGTANTNITSVTSRVSALEGAAKAGAYYGSWTDNSSGGSVNLNLNASETGAGRKVDVIGAVQLETPVGCSMSAGTFTANQAGKWDFKFAVQYGNGPTVVRAIYLALGNATSSPSGAKYGLIGVPQADALASSARLRLTAGQTVSVYYAVWTGTERVQVWQAAGNMLTATWIGP